VQEQFAQEATGSYLAVGAGRSYGDSCLNQSGTVIQFGGISRLIAFDADQGILTCEAGMQFADILDFIVPKGWFLPVTPGTMYVTVGGALATDVHGKNHHMAGTFGRHVLAFGLLRSTGEVIECSETSNRDLFRATIGGLGLTGIIMWAAVRLRPIHSVKVVRRSTRIRSIDSYFALDTGAASQAEYTVAWIDSTARGRNLGRGIFYHGNHEISEHHQGLRYARPLQRLSIPKEIPSFLLNAMTMQIFNNVYYRRLRDSDDEQIVDFAPFFYPLDAIGGWNKLYGPKGFYQFQCVVPLERPDTLIKLLELAADSRLGSFLTVLKRFGAIPSPGLLSFPMEGYTLAMDFRNLGARTRNTIEALTRMVCEASGRIYPAKDALMTRQDFHSGFPNWHEFSTYVDPKVTSDFLERIR
jgi:FAD/FMN-containing dehydrogenase